MIRERAYNGMPGLPAALRAAPGGCGPGLDARDEHPIGIGARDRLCGADDRAVDVPDGRAVHGESRTKARCCSCSATTKAPPRSRACAGRIRSSRKKKVSLRVRNFESSHLKVNDIDGNPIEIAAVVVWKVFETAEAVFEVDDYEHYVKVQSESALRNLATSYAYDAHDDAQVSLRGHTNAVADHLKREIHERLVKAGVEVIEARISHLAYAPEIAAAMLQRQQAGAIIAARQRIVEGAVGMVEMALDMLSKKSIIQLDEERKAAMVSNLLVVLCGDRNTQPVINTGTIYQ